MKNYKTVITDLLFYTAGCFVYAAAVAVIAAPNSISPGGITGIATVINSLTGIPAGIMTLVINMPLLILAYKILGGGFIVKTGIATVCVSLFLDLTGKFLPEIKIDGVLAAVFGGLIMGVGLSLVMIRGATTGGVDIIAKLINRKWQHLSIGRLMLIMDAFVVLLNVAVYGSLQSGLYTVISLFASSRVMDALLYGAGRGNLIYVITENKNLAGKLIAALGRGITVLPATGGYTGNNKQVLMCAVRSYETARLFRFIKSEDPYAFSVVLSAGEIRGEGFKKLD